MKKKIIALLSAAIMVTGLVGCGAGSGGSASAGDSKDKKVIYFIPIVDTGAYWSPMKKSSTT